jgi:hypothetical protein
MHKLLPDEIAYRFGKTLIDGGVSHEDMEKIVLSPNAPNFASRLKPYIILFAAETKVDPKEPAA